MQLNFGASFRNVLCASLVAGVALSARPASTAEYGNSLDWVPADASVYSASLRLKEQVQIVAKSNAWKQFREIPAVAMGWQMAEMQINNPNGPAAMFWQLMELPENKQLAKLVGEMFSEEIVFYAGEDFNKLLKLFQVVQGSKIAPLIQGIESGDSTNPAVARMQLVIEAIEEDPSLLNVPQLVFAFRVEDEEAAKTQLARLEVFANMALEQTEVGAKFEREELGESEFIVLTLEGSMIPWEDEVPMGFPGDEESYQKIKEILSEKKVAIALGSWNNYVILSIAQSTDHLESLGEGDAIGGRDEFAALAEHADGKLVSVHYISREVVEANYFKEEELDEMATELDAALQESEDVPDEVKERLTDDLPELADDLKKYVGRPGATAGFALLTDTGFEGYSYSWSDMPGLDGSQPLELTNHVGGSPILALVTRGKHDPQDYETLSKWFGKALGYFEDFALEEMDDEERVEAEQALEIAKPLLERLDKTTREHLIPALEDSQSAIVLDADIRSKQWHDDMPESFTELPMAEFAVVVGVSDAKALRQAMTEYREIAADAVDAIREKHPEAIPADYEIPEADEREVSGGTVYQWRLPSEAELDDKIALCGAIGDHVAAFATSAALAERVLAETPLEAVEQLAGSEEPRAIVAGIDFAGLVTAIEPWVEYAIRASSNEESVGDDPQQDDADVKGVRTQVAMGMEILKCFRGAWMETHEEDGVWVTHSISTFEDLKD